MTERGEGDREEFETEIHDCVDEGGVEGDGGDDGFGGEHAEWPGELFGDDGVDGEVEVFVGVPVGWVLGFAEMLGFPREEDKGVEFGKEEVGHQKGDEDPDGVGVFGPAPAEMWVFHDGGADERAEVGPAVHGNGVEADGCAAGFFAPHVAEGGGYVADGGGAEEAGEEAGEEDGGGVVAGGGADGEEGQAEDRGEDADASAPDFGDGGPDDRAEDEADPGGGRVSME